ncbi:MAG: PhzF family phenazine biosynthesis protein [candidate division Zixibacteria bacterium]
MKIKIFQVDSFTDVPFKGNPAGVCILEKPLSDELMQSIAAEMNVAETAFAVPVGDKDIKSQNRFNLRWFTPTVEVDLCGHATLATAKVLFDEYNINSETISFATKSGELSVSRNGDKLAMDFPADPTDHIEIPEEALKAYGIRESIEARKSRRMGMPLIEVASADIVRSVKPDFSRIMGLDGEFGSAIITARSDDANYDFISRFFAPKFGIDEDPVTGAAHTVLGPYWAEKLGKTILKAYQASARGGEVELNVRGDRIELIGQAVIVLEGEMEIP